MLKEQFSNELKLYEILSSAFAILKKYAKEITVINLVFWAPFLFLIYYFLNFSTPVISIFYKRLLFGIFLSSIELFPIIAVILIAELESRKDTFEKPTLSQILKASMQRWNTASSVTGLALLPILAGIFLLIIPGIIAMVYFSFVLQVAILRGITGIKAIERSCKLVDGRWFKIFGFVVTLNIITWIISIWGCVDWLNTGVPFASQGYVFASAIILIGAFVNTFSKIAMTLTFLNLEAVKAKSY